MLFYSMATLVRVKVFPILFLFFVLYDVIPLSVFSVHEIVYS